MQRAARRTAIARGSVCDGLDNENALDAKPSDFALGGNPCDSCLNACPSSCGGVTGNSLVRGTIQLQASPANAKQAEPLMALSNFTQDNAFLNIGARPAKLSAQNTVPRAKRSRCLEKTN